MVIKNYLFISVLFLGLMAQGMNARVNVGRIAGYMQTQVKPRRTTYQTVANQAAVFEPAVQAVKKPGRWAHFTEPFHNDIAVFKAQTSTFQDCIVEPAKTVCTQLVKDPVNRQLLALRAAEYVATAPGMALAYAGDYQLAGFVAAECLRHGHWGIAASLSTMFGAAYYYGLSLAKNYVEQKSAYVMNSVVNQHNITGIANRDAI